MPSRRNRRKVAITRTVATGGCPGPAMGGASQHSITVAIKSKILSSNSNSVAQRPEMGFALPIHAVRSTQPRVVVETASKPDLGYLIVQDVEPTGPGARSMETAVPDIPLRSPAMPVVPPSLASALECAAAAVARLDQALVMHPLRPAFLHRARLEAVRRQAGIDGQAIDPWHLAAVLEGLRLRMDHALRIIDRGMIFEAARHALRLHQWLTLPDFDQEGEIQHAAATLVAAEAGATPLLAAAHGLHAWLDGGGARAPMRAALIRHWTRHGLLRAPVPLTGTAALRPGTPWDYEAWAPIFLTALADEAADGLQLLFDMERAWFAARRAVAGRRRTSRAAAAVDVMAATPLVSATSLAAGLGMANKNAAALLDGLCADGLAVEVTHRSKRRLFGLAGLAPLREQVAPPRRPMPGRGRGRPPMLPVEDAPSAPLPAGPLGPVERRAFDYSELEAAMAFADQTLRQVRHNLDVLLTAEAAATSG